MGAETVTINNTKTPSGIGFSGVIHHESTKASNAGSIGFGVDQIQISGTTTASVLSISSSHLVGIGAVVARAAGSFPLGQLSAGHSVLNGPLDLAYAGSISLGQLTNAAVAIASVPTGGMSIKVAGAILNSSINVSGKVKSFVASSMFGSSLLVGATVGTTAQSANASNVGIDTLSSFKLTLGHAIAFSDSTVIAGHLVSSSLSLVDPSSEHLWGLFAGGFTAISFKAGGGVGKHFSAKQLLLGQSSIDTLLQNDFPGIDPLQFEIAVL